MYTNAKRAELIKDFYLYGSYFSYYHRAFMACHNFVNGGIERIEYPDGRCYLEQTPLLINIFNVIEEELLQLISREAKKRHG